MRLAEIGIDPFISAARHLADNPRAWVCGGFHKEFALDRLRPVVHGAQSSRPFPGNGCRHLDQQIRCESQSWRGIMILHGDACRNVSHWRLAIVRAINQEMP
jgi:hypothetical protein